MEKEIEANLQLAETAYNMVVTFLIDYSFHILGAIIIFVLGLFVSRWIARLAENFFLKHNVDVTLSKFLSNAVRITFMAFVLIICLGKFGISVAPFIAAIGAVSLGAGLALQGPLSNYGAGLIIVITRPFVVGNTITVLNVSGLVSEVRMACTILETEDGEHITIPNRQILGEILRNSYENRVWEGEIGIAYGSDPEKAIALVKAVLRDDAAVVHDPEPQVGIQRFGESSVDIGFRYWAPTPQYFNTAYRVNLAIWRAFKENGIAIPFPQREVRMITDKA
jgi:small conductance mechanosensitive channel